MDNKDKQSEVFGGAPSKNGAPSLTDRWLERRIKPPPAHELVRLQLPSGDEVQARRLNVAALLTMGNIPNRLLPVVVGWVTAFQAGADLEDSTKRIQEEIQKDVQSFIEMLSFVWRSCVIDPVFVPDEEYRQAPGTLPMAMVSLDDMQYLFEWAQGVDEAAVAWFRKRQSADLAAMAKSPILRGETLDPPGHSE